MTGVYYFERYLDSAEQYYFKEEVANQLTEDYLWKFLDKDFDSFYKFLSSAFTWGQSKQGFYYWELISRRDHFDYNLSVTIMNFIESEFYDYSQERLNEIADSVESFVKDRVSPNNFNKWNIQ